jgi:pyruvate dehydrogenase E1 component
MVPFYMYYSMFGFQRVGDFCWAAGDMQARGFLLGCTAGRTTLEGEGLQHADGHSHVLFSTIPNCVCYDPAYAYEIAVIVRDGMKRMLEKQENVFYYISLMNENYVHPPMPKDVEEAIIRGMYQLKRSKKKAKTKRVQLLGSGTILLEVEAAADLLEKDYGVAADVWSVTSFTELRREADKLDHDALLNPGKKRPSSWVEACLGEQSGPVIAATDYIKALPDMIRPWVKAPYHVLGTDGFGRSDTRPNLRHFFEVDRHFVALAALSELAKMGEIESSVVKDAIKRYGIDPKKSYPPEQ